MKIASIYAKGIAAVTAAAGILVADGLLSGSAERYTNAAIAVVGAVAVYFLPNTSSTATHTQDGA